MLCLIFYITILHIKKKLHNFQIKFFIKFGDSATKVG